MEHTHTKLSDCRKEIVRVQKEVLGKSRDLIARESRKQVRYLTAARLRLVTDAQRSEFGLIADWFIGQDEEGCFRALQEFLQKGDGN